MPLSKHVYCVAVAFKMTEWVEQWICIKFCVKLEHSSGNYLDDSKGFQGQCNECSANKSGAQVLQRWLRICWKWSTFWKACNKQNTWECWMCRGCNQQRSITDSAGPRSWSGDSKHYCVWDLDAGSWHEMCHAKICGSWWRFQQRILQSVLNSGRDARRTVWGPKVPTLKGTETSLSYVQCFLDLQ